MQENIICPKVKSFPTCVTWYSKSRAVIFNMRMVAGMAVSHIAGTELG